MNRHERRAQAKAGKAKSGAPPSEAASVAPGQQRLAVLHAAALQEALAGRFLEALSRCRDALALDADNADSMHLMGVVSLEAREPAHAVEWAARAIGREPKPAYLTTLGLAFSALGRHDDALMAFDTAIALGDDDAQAWWQKANALLAMGRSPEALAAFQQTLRRDASHADAAYKCAYLLHGLGRLDEALAHLDRSAALQSQHAHTFHLRALVLKQLDRLDEARADGLRAIELDPANADAIGNLGAVLQTQGRIEEALPWYERALQLRPDVPRMLTNKAAALAELGSLDEAMAIYRRALAIDPESTEAAWNLALLQLLQGDFENGLKGREVRWRFREELRPSYPTLSAPLWLGEPLVGKTIVVCADEGLGDTIQFARYLPLLAARGARVILVVEAALCPLLSRVAGVAQCLPKHPDTRLPAFDLHCPINCLPLAFGTRLATIPSAQNYLPLPPADRLRAWDDRLGPHDRLRVGLVWSGNVRHQNDRNRSIMLSTLARLLEVDACFVSLQKDPRPRDAELLRTRSDIVDPTAGLSDFAETAALVACLDLLISVDTSVAHLAGALGKPVWLLLPHMPDFRWLLGRDDSPWYPAHRLFRQGASREYDSVIDRMRGELAALAGAFTPH